MAAIFYQVGGQGQTFFMEFDATLNETHDSSSDITQHPVEDGSVITDHVRPRPDALSLNVFVSNHPISLQKAHADFRDAVEDTPQGFLIPEGTATATELLLGQPRRRPLPVQLIAAGRFGDLERVSLPNLPFVTNSGFLPALPQIPQWFAAPEQDQEEESFQVTTLQHKEGFDRSRQMYEQFITLQRSGQLLTVVTKIREYENMVIESMSVPRDSGSANSLTLQVNFIQVRIVESRTIDLPEALEARGQARRGRGSRASNATNDEEQERVDSTGPTSFLTGTRQSALAQTSDSIRSYFSGN